MCDPHAQAFTTLATTYMEYADEQAFLDSLDPDQAAMVSPELVGALEKPGHNRTQFTSISGQQFKDRT